MSLPANCYPLVKHDFFGHTIQRIVGGPAKKMVAYIRLRTPGVYTTDLATHFGMTTLLNSLPPVRDASCRDSGRLNLSSEVREIYLRQNIGLRGAEPHAKEVVVFVALTWCWKLFLLVVDHPINTPQRWSIYKMWKEPWGV